MLFLVMPVAFVDRTDAYRIRGRGGRLAIALAGMVSDGWWCAVVAIVAHTSTGDVHQVAQTLLVIQLIGLLVNLNPLLPSDGYSAVETATRLVDVRGRSLALVRSTVLRRPLPPYLRDLTTRARAGYTTYGVLACLYVGLVIVVCLHSTTTAIAAVAGEVR
jgi:putative peptide zinc metalloprotease protein